MKQAGYSLSEIAEHLGLSDGHEVVRLLQVQYEKDSAFLTEDQRTLILGLEFGRLEKLIRANLPSAELGDPKSADIVLKAIAMEVKLTKLDVADSATDQARVLVVGGAEAEYIARLKGMTS